MSSSPRKTPARQSDSHKRVTRSATITHWPLRDQWATSLLMCGLLVAFSWLVGKQLQSLPSAIGTLLAMLAVSWRNWVPVKFVISPIGIEQSFLRFSRRISWNHFRRCEVRPRGLLLLPDASNSLLGALKGTYIHCGDREGEILELVTTYLQRRRGTGSSVRRRAAS